MASVSTSPRVVAGSDHQDLPPMPVTLHRAGQWIIMLLLVAAPLVFLPDRLLANAFDTPRRLLLLLGAGVLLALILMSWAKRGRVISRRHPLDLPVLLFAAAAVITGFTSAYPWIPFWGPVWSKDGLQVLGTAILLYFGVKEFIRGPEAIVRAICAMIIAGGIVALVGIIEYLGIINFHLSLSGHRLTGTMGNSLFTGTYLATLLPLSAAAAIYVADTRRRLILAGCFAVMLPALIFTLARAAWLACIIAGILTLLMAIQPLRQDRTALPRFRWILLLVLITAGLTAAIWYLHRGMAPDRQTMEKRLASLTNLSGDDSAQDRKGIMLGGVRMFLARPLLGWGTGVSRFILPEYKPAGGNRGYIQAPPHSVPLQVAAEMGVIGLLPYLLLLGMIIRHSFLAARRRDRFAWVGVGLFGAFLANILANLTGIDNAATLSLFWMGLGLLAACTAEDRPFSLRPDPTAATGASGTRIYALCGILLIAFVSLFVVMQFLAAYYLQRGVDGVNRLYEVAKTDRFATKSIGDRVASDVNRSMALTLMPPLPHPGAEQREVYDGDSLSLQTLAKVYQAQSHVYPDAVSILSAHHLMINAGEDNLARLDRDSILGDLIVEHMRFKDNRSLNYHELVEARKLMTKLLAFSPACSETHLLNAQLLDLEQKPEEARREVEYTLQLDPNYFRAKLLLGHLLKQEALFSGPRQAELARQACALFREAQLTAKSGETFSTADSSDYAMALLLNRNIPQAAALARTFRGQPEFGELIRAVRALCWQPAYMKDGEQLLKSLNAYTPQ